MDKEHKFISLCELPLKFLKFLLVTRIISISACKQEAESPKCYFRWRPLHFPHFLKKCPLDELNLHSVACLRRQVYHSLLTELFTCTPPLLDGNPKCWCSKTHSSSHLTTHQIPGRKSLGLCCLQHPPNMISPVPS